MRAGAILACLTLAACVEAAPVGDCCVPGRTEAEAIAEVGLPEAAILAQSGYEAPGADGLTRLFVQFDPRKTTDAQTAAVPDTLCRSQGLSLRATFNTEAGKDDLAIPGSRVIRAICS